MEKKLIRIRYNNDCTDGKSYWRAIIDGNEYQVENILINIPTKTTKDYLEDKKTFKWHISCESNDYSFKDGVLLIN